MVKPAQKHYSLDGFEAIDIIETVVLRVGSASDPAVAYMVGNALKYILRAGHKDDLRADLEKAYTYIGRAVLLMDNRAGWPPSLTPASDCVDISELSL